MTASRHHRRKRLAMTRGSAFRVKCLSLCNDIYIHESSKCHLTLCFTHFSTFVFVDVFAGVFGGLLNIAMDFEHSYGQLSPSLGLWTPIHPTFRFSPGYRHDLFVPFSQSGLRSIRSIAIVTNVLWSQGRSEWSEVWIHAVVLYWDPLGMFQDNTGDPGLD